MSGKNNKSNDNSSNGGIFSDEIKSLDNMISENNDLYDKTKKVFDKNIKMSTQSKGSMLSGTSSSDRNVNELGKTLTSIRQTSINIVKEKANIKKMNSDVSLRERQLNIEEDSNNSDTTLVAKKFMELLGIDAAKNIRKSDGKKGLDLLNDDDVKLTKVDNEMIENYNGGSRSVID